MAKHPFKEAINERESNLYECERDMLILSRRICKAAEISDSELEIAESNRLTFKAGDFLIEARYVRIQSAWRNILMVTPRCVGGNFGWSNVPENPFPDGWRYYAKGTCTAVAPSEEIADEIVALVSKLGK